MKNWPIRIALFISGSLLCLITLVAVLYYLGYFGNDLTLRKTVYQELPGWEQADQTLSLSAFQQSCTAILKLNPRQHLGTQNFFGTVEHWQAACQVAKKIVHPNVHVARQFFERWFQPYQVVNHLNPVGLFTGYYLPLLRVSLTRDTSHKIPIYGLPSPALTTYPTRAAIENGALHWKAPIIAWGENPIDVFFAQIQGSAIAQTRDQKTFLLSYAGDNKQPYTAIGKVLRQRGLLAADNISMQSIRAWLTAHPTQVTDILDQNASYVFFKKSSVATVSGSEKVPLTPHYSLAVDTHFMPLGAPLWLSTTLPPTAISFQQLMIAQDTGGAIKGVIRGDVFWGAGKNAEYIAGHMQSSGRYWILLPRTHQPSN